jgi:Flp pilus assembly protein TadD
MNRRERRAAAKHGKLDLHAPALNGNAAIYNAAVAEMGAGRYFEAQIPLQAGEKSPEDPEILHLMALVCFNAKQFDHAVEWASRAIRRDPKPTYLTTLGTALVNLGHQEDALKVFDKAVQLKPDDAGLWSNFGDALVLARRPPDAISLLQKGVRDRSGLLECGLPGGGSAARAGAT